MSALAEDPVLGHITTFGGHPVCCAAGMAAMKALLEEKMMDGVKKKARLFLDGLSHPSIKAIRSNGLWISLQFESFETNKKVIDHCIANGILTDWFLFAPDCLRLSPPLVISNEQIEKACGVILQAVASI
jgi:acetylornithine/succinyldiaminopimelate/putrescine aminotransferase